MMQTATPKKRMEPSKPLREGWSHRKHKRALSVVSMPRWRSLLARNVHPQHVATAPCEQAVSICNFLSQTTLNWLIMRTVAVDS